MSTTDLLSRDEIDHEAEAKRLLEETAPFQKQHLEVAMASAQSHATLALVDAQREANEQARIANQLFAHVHGGDAHLSDSGRIALWGRR